MKFHWFHLMPYPQLPENFKTDYRSVWVDVPSSLFDPKVGHKAYNDYLDELEYAESVGFDGICVNEHHQNAYGLMPSPNLIAASLARRTSKAKLVVMGNSVALYDPPTRVAEEMAMLDCCRAGGWSRDSRSGTPMDTVYRLWQIAGDLARQILRGREAHPARLDRARALRLQRQIHPAPLRQCVAAADPEAASAGLDPRRRQRRDLGLVRRQRLPLREPVLFRLHRRPEGDRRLLGGRRAQGQGQESLSRRLPAIRRRGARRCRGREALFRPRDLFLFALPPYLSGLRQSAGLYLDRRRCAPASRAWSRAQRGGRMSRTSPGKR